MCDVMQMTPRFTSADRKSNPYSTPWTITLQLFAPDWKRISWRSMQKKRSLWYSMDLGRSWTEEIFQKWSWTTRYWKLSTKLNFLEWRLIPRSYSRITLRKFKGQLRPDSGRLEWSLMLYQLRMRAMWSMHLFPAIWNIVRPSEQELVKICSTLFENCKDGLLGQFWNAKLGNLSQQAFLSFKSCLSTKGGSIPLTWIYKARRTTHFPDLLSFVKNPRLRQNLKILCPTGRTKLWQNSFCSRAASLFAKLPAVIFKILFQKPSAVFNRNWKRTISVVYLFNCLLYLDLLLCVDG